MPSRRQAFIAGWGTLAICALVGIFLGTGIFTFHTAQGISYFSNDPRACINCHIMREPFDSWQKSSHHAFATCNDCHVSQHPIGKWVSKADNGFRHSWAFTFQNFHEPIQMHPRGERTLRQNCISCHTDVLSQVLQHTLLDADMDCVRCHRSVGHAAKY